MSAKEKTWVAYEYEVTLTKPIEWDYGVWEVGTGFCTHFEPRWNGIRVMIGLHNETKFLPINAVEIKKVRITTTNTVTREFIPLEDE